MAYLPIASAILGKAAAVGRFQMLHLTFSIQCNPSRCRGLRKFSSKQHGKNSIKKRPKLKKRSNDLEEVWYSTSRPRPAVLEMGRYGLKRLDYNTLKPPVWTLPPQPPKKSIADKVVYPITLLVVASFAAWVYLNPDDEDMKDYWRRVETGEILLDDDEDDEDDWDNENSK
jgi:hypothetical protein